MERDDDQVLGVRPEASPTEVKAAFRRKVRQLHPDRQVSSDGTAEPGGSEAFLELTEAYHRRLAVRAARSASGLVPTQRSRSAMGRTPSREDDPMLTLLTLPQRCREPWPTRALEVWALTVVPGARVHLVRAREAAEGAGAVHPRHRTMATAHVLVTLALAGRTSRRYAVLADRLDAAYSALERNLPPAVVLRLPPRVTQVGPPRHVTLVACGAGAALGAIAVWADIPGGLLG